MAYIPQAQRSRQNGIVNQSQFGNAQNSPAMGAPSFAIGAPSMGAPPSGNAQNSPAMGAPAMGAPPSGNAQIQPISMAPPSPQGQQNWVTPGTFPGQNAPGTAPPPGTATLIRSLLSLQLVRPLLTLLEHSLFRYWKVTITYPLLNIL